MNIVSNQIPVELCNIIQSYQSDLYVSNKKSLFKQVHKDIKVAYDRLDFYQDLLKEKPNRIEWVCRLIYINKVLFKNDNNNASVHRDGQEIFHHHY